MKYEEIEKQIGLRLEEVEKITKERAEKENILLKGLSKESFFYYLHSYYFECNDPENIIATTEYINKFTCVVSKENIFGIQFHPEKSHDAGSILLKNFSDL